MSEEEMEEFKQEMEAQGEELREAMAEDLGGDPEDYEARRRLADGGDE
jgi:hypothetical protein